MCPRRRHRLALAVTTVVTPAEAQAYKPEFRNSHVAAENTSFGRAGVRFVELLKERTQGRINGNALAPERRGHPLNETRAILSRDERLA